VVQTDILVSLGVDFEPLTAVGRDKLRVKVTLPESISPGRDITIRVQASNGGARSVSCLVGRLFSRHSWLSGINFYLGNIPAGETREFERRVQVPADAAAGGVFGVVGFWDLLGTAKEAAQAVSSRIVPADAAPPAVTP
jgi:hypothetical protein